MGRPGSIASARRQAVTAVESSPSTVAASPIWCHASAFRGSSETARANAAITPSQVRGWRNSSRYPRASQASELDGSRRSASSAAAIPRSSRLSAGDAPVASQSQSSRRAYASPTRASAETNPESSAAACRYSAVARTSPVEVRSCDAFRHPPRDVLLEGEQAVVSADELVAPHARAGRGVRQLDGDAHGAVRALHAAGHEIRDAQSPADYRGIGDVRAAEPPYRGA